MAEEEVHGPVCVGIDMGWANLGVCALRLQDDGSVSILTCRRERILAQSLATTHDNLFWAMMKWVMENEALLRQAQIIMLERQMQDRLKCMNVQLRTLFPDKVVVVAPKTLCRQYGLPMKRAAKKAATVKLVTQRLPAFPAGQGKDDDMADAALMCLYAVDKYAVEKKAEV